MRISINATPANQPATRENSSKNSNLHSIMRIATYSSSRHHQRRVVVVYDAARRAGTVVTATLCLEIELAVATAASQPATAPPSAAIILQYNWQTLSLASPPMMPSRPIPTHPHSSSQCWTGHFSSGSNNKLVPVPHLYHSYGDLRCH